VFDRLSKKHSIRGTILTNLNALLVKQ